MRQLEPLRPGETDLVGRAQEMMRGGAEFGILLRRVDTPSAPGDPPTYGEGGVEVTWPAAGVLEARAGRPWAGTGTLFRAVAEPAGGSVLLSGVARGTTYRVWTVLLFPAVFLLACVVVGTALEGLWGPSVFALVLWLVAAVPFWRLGTRRGTARYRGRHLADLARTVWQREGTPVRDGAAR